MHLDRSPFHSISLYGSVIHIRARARSPAIHTGRGSSVLHSRRRSADWIGLLGGGPGGKKKGGIARIYERPVARDSSKIEAIPTVATLRTAERPDTFRWLRCVALRAIAVQIARGTFIQFYVNREIWRTGECAKTDREKKKTEITRRGEFARELKADDEV